MTRKKRSKREDVNRERSFKWKLWKIVSGMLWRGIKSNRYRRKL